MIEDLGIRLWIIRPEKIRTLEIFIHINPSICIRSTHISTLSFLGTQDEPSQAMAIVKWLHRKVASSFLHCLLLPCEAQLWSHLNGHSFCCRVLVFVSVSLSVPFHLFLTHFSNWYFINKKKPETSCILSYRSNCSEVGLVVYLGLCLFDFCDTGCLVFQASLWSLSINMCHLTCSLWFWESTLLTELLYQHRSNRW